jgi:transposase-like protein
MDKSLPGFTDRERQPTASSSCSRSFFSRLVAWFATAVWRTRVDWRDKRPLLIRATAHLTIVILALTAIGLSGVAVHVPQIAAGGASDSNAISSAITDRSADEAASLPDSVAATNVRQSRSTDADTITRQAVLHTTFPDRPRAEVVTYTVKEGDNISTIAYQHDLLPETIVWSNREAIQDAPWLIQPGLQLFILPVDGVYHTVSAGETVAGIASEYDVEPSAIYNQWNDLEEGDELFEGQLLVIPGGVGWDITWNPPQPEPTQSGYGYRYSASSVNAPSANNWFILPTGHTLVSGWYFRDPRNPGHIGLDYKCHLGDPLYAADNGAVTIAGWHGGYGILVEIDHGNGFITRYGHLSQLLVGGGQAIRQGDVIGYCGNTGWSTGPHLHYEIRKNGVPQDPMAYQP